MARRRHRRGRTGFPLPRRAPPQHPWRVILIEPGEAHDRRAGSGAGFAYRMLHLPQPWLAAACGFADQSHPGRWFRRAYGLPPAAYARSSTAPA